MPPARPCTARLSPPQRAVRAPPTADQSDARVVRERATALFSGMFASIYLVAEVSFKMLASLLSLYTELGASGFALSPQLLS